jgi:hypothetical protein
MTDLPLSKRPFHAFLSHAHIDKSFADRLDTWLSEAVGIPVWYDSRNLPSGARIANYLGESIIQARSLILLLSKASAASGWVEEEYNLAMEQRAKFKEFTILPIRIEACDPPPLLRTTKWIDVLDGSLNLDTAKDLLSAFYPDPGRLDARTRDIYVSRSWRPSEAGMWKFVCRKLDQAGFRLICDSKDQPHFGEGSRVRSIISSCGALAAILPDRGDGATSQPILEEIDIARDLGLPLLLVAEETVELPKDLAGLAIRLPATGFENGSAVRSLEHQIEGLMEDWRPSSRPHYVFYSTKFKENAARNQKIMNLVERITAMPCLKGDDIPRAGIQQEITAMIRNSFLTIADISGDNLNTCIEAGIVRGAGRPLYLVASGPRHSPPFMFRDQQVWYFEDDAGLVGAIHRIVYPFRRRVINRELEDSPV